MKNKKPLSFRSEVMTINNKKYEAYYINNKEVDKDTYFILLDDPDSDVTETNCMCGDCEDCGRLYNENQEIDFEDDFDDHDEFEDYDSDDYDNNILNKLPKPLSEYLIRTEEDAYDDCDCPTCAVIYEVLKEIEDADDEDEAMDILREFHKYSFEEGRMVAFDQISDISKQIADAIEKDGM